MKHGLIIDVSSKRILYNSARYVGFALILFAYCIVTLQTAMISGIMNPVSFFPFVLPWILNFFLLFSALGITAETLTRAKSGTLLHKSSISLLFRFLITFLIVICSAMGWGSDIPTTVLLTVAAAAAAYRLREDRLLKGILWIEAGFVLVFFFLSMLGIVENNRGNSFGFIYRTDYACRLLSLALCFCLLKDGRLGWAGELGLIALSLFNFFFVGGKTCFICLLILIPVTLLRNYRRGGVPYQDAERYGKLIPLLFRGLYFLPSLADRGIKRLRLGRLRPAALALVKWAYPICAGVSILLTAIWRLLQPLWDKLPGLSSVKSRLLYGRLAMEEYPLSLFGSPIHMAGYGGSEQGPALYFFLDNAYVAILLRFGLVFLLLFLALMTAAQVRFAREKHPYAMFLLAVFALDCLMDFELMDLSYNVFILLAFCVHDRADAEMPKRENPAIAPDRRRLLGAVCVPLCLLFALWAYTAGEITAWRGWTPTSGATLLVPGSGIDAWKSPALETKRLDRARLYLNLNSGAACIVLSPEAKDWLTANGIEAERIRVTGETSDPGELLLRAQSLIDGEGLPPRLTVCTYAMQQGRFAKAAEALHIPVNSLTMKMPAKWYLPSFAAEQWRVLWGK